MKKDDKLIFNESLDAEMANANFENGLSVDEVPALKARLARKRAEQEIPVHSINTSSWELIRQNLHNQQKIDELNLMIHRLFA